MSSLLAGSLTDKTPLITKSINVILNLWLKVPMRLMYKK